MSVRFNSLYSNDSLKAIFSEAVENRKLIHGFILEGAKGTGKQTFAREIAKAVCCPSEDRPCNACEICRKIDEGILVDINYYDIPEGKSEITVECIRSIREDTYTLPCEAEYKFYIINNAQAMNVNAQNAFLKILEEPPTYVYFIMLTDNSSILLPTIRSRAPIFRMQTLEQSELKNILFSDFPKAKAFAEQNSDAFEHILLCSEGSLGYCIEHCDIENEDSRLVLFENAKEFISVALSKDRKNLAILSGSLPSAKESLRGFLCFVRSGLRDLIIYKKSSNFKPLFYSEKDGIFETADIIDSEFLISSLEITEEQIQRIDINCNINLIKTDYFSKIGALCRR